MKSINEKVIRFSIRFYNYFCICILFMFILYKSSPANFWKSCQLKRNEKIKFTYEYSYTSRKHYRESECARDVKPSIFIERLDVLHIMTVTLTSFLTPIFNGDVIPATSIHDVTAPAFHSNASEGPPSSFSRHALASRSRRKFYRQFSLRFTFVRFIFEIQLIWNFCVRTVRRLTCLESL